MLISYPDYFTINDIKMFYGYSHKTPLIAKFFKFEADSKDKYLREINIYTESATPNSEFELILQEPDKDGQPGNLFYDGEIKGVANKGRCNTKIDISNLKLKFPDNGLFIVFQWLVVEVNKSQFNYHKGKDTEKRYIYDTIEPTVGAYPSDENSGWIFGNHGWEKVKKNELKILSKYRNKFAVPAISLVLS